MAEPAASRPEDERFGMVGSELPVGRGGRSAVVRRRASDHDQDDDDDDEADDASARSVGMRATVPEGRPVRLRDGTAAMVSVPFLGSPEVPA